MQVVMELLHNKRASLMQLNDDCLIHIIKFVKPSDLIAITKTNKRLRCLVQHESRFLRFSTIPGQSDFLSREDATKLLSIMGGNSLQNLQIKSRMNYNDVQYIDAIQSHCKQLRRLQLEYWNLRDFTAMLRIIFAQLEELRLLNCYFEECSLSACQFTTLEIMNYDFCKNHCTRRDNRIELIALENLTLTRCTFGLLSSIFKMPSAKSVRLQMCSANSDGFIEDVAKAVPDIETFSISIQPFHRKMSLLAIRDMKFLRSLSISGLDYNCFIDELLTSLSKDCCLQQLTVRLTPLNSHTLRYVAALRNLEEFHFCFELTDEHLKALEGCYVRHIDYLMVNWVSDEAIYGFVRNAKRLQTVGLSFHQSSKSIDAIVDGIRNINSNIIVYCI